MGRRVHLQIEGRVQGVFFRDSARRAAREQRLTGWVRNRFDGAVEIVVEGEEAAIGAFLDWCRRGPPQARVDGVEVADEPPRGDFAEFDILPTA